MFSTRLAIILLYSKLVVNFFCMYNYSYDNKHVRIREFSIIIFKIYTFYDIIKYDQREKTIIQGKILITEQYQDHYQVTRNTKQSHY